LNLLKHVNDWRNYKSEWASIARLLFAMFSANFVIVKKVTFSEAY